MVCVAESRRNICIHSGTWQQQCTRNGRGMFEEVNLDAQCVDIASGTEIVSGMTSGDVIFGSLGPESLPDPGGRG